MNEFPKQSEVGDGGNGELSPRRKLEARNLATLAAQISEQDKLIYALVEDHKKLLDTLTTVLSRVHAMETLVINQKVQTIGHGPSVIEENPEG